MTGLIAFGSLLAPLSWAQDATDEEVDEMAKEFLEEEGMEKFLENAAAGQAIIQKAQSQSNGAAPVTTMNAMGMKAAGMTGPDRGPSGRMGAGGSNPGQVGAGGSSPGRIPGWGQYGPQFPWRETLPRPSPKTLINGKWGDGTYESLVKASEGQDVPGSRKMAILRLTIHSGDFVEMEQYSVQQEIPPESPEYQGWVDTIQKMVRRSVDRIGQGEGGEVVKERVLAGGAVVFKEIFRGQEDPFGPDKPRPGPQPDKPTQEGQDHLGNGDWEGARESFDEALAKDPKNVAALGGRAQASYMMGDFAGAAGDSKAALAIEPGNKAAFATLKLSESRVPDLKAGSAGAKPADASQFGEFGSGEGSKNLAVSQPHIVQSAAKLKLVEKALRVGDHEKALFLAQNALELNPNNAKAHFYRSVAHSNLGRYRLALLDANAGLRSAPGNAALLNAKAFALNRLGQFKEALKTANQALELNPQDATAYANRAYALGGMGDREAMLENLRKAAELDPKFKASLRSALQMPSDSDLLFLFPGETMPRDARSGALAERKRGLNPGTLALCVLGALLAVGLFAWAFGSARSAMGTKAAPAGRGSAATGGARMMGALPSVAVVGEREGGRLREKFEIIRQVGGGGMGVVFEGLDRSLKRKVAIKKMREELRLDRREKERFLSEARLVAALHHPNIVDIYSIVEDEGEVYLVFEYVDGATLHDEVARKGPMPLERAVGVFQGVAEALDFAHGRKVIHRDMKPSNVMLDRDGYAKVMDFGVARLAKDAANRFSVTNTVMGTPPYMAPEQETGQVRKESDVYSMAVCLYEALSGRRPFSGGGAGMLLNKMNMTYAPLSGIMPGLPAGIDDVFARAFSADPEKRFASAGEFMKAVAGLPSAAGKA